MRAWLIVNPAAGSVSRADAIDNEASARGVTIAGRTIFPDDPFPAAETLDAAAIDLLILLGGDGTINAAARALDHWEGRALILPGGTMNLLAKRMHGNADAATIVARSTSACRANALLFVEAGPHRAFVAMIAGPPSAWAHAREAVRKGRLHAAWRAARLAWLRSFSTGVRVRGTRRRLHRAVVITPEEQGMSRLRFVSTIDETGA